MKDDVEEIHFENPFVDAAHQGNLATMYRLIATGENPDSIEPSNSTNALQAASAAGHLKIVQFLLYQGANINFFNSQGNTALHHATEAGHLDVVQCLLENKANPNVTNSLFITPLFESVRQGSLKITEALLNHGAKASTSKFLRTTPLYQAAKDGHYELVKLLLEKEADPNIATTSGRTPLHEAAQNNFFKIAKALLNHGANPNAATTSFDENTGTGVGWTPLLFATAESHPNMVKLILKKGAYPEMKNAEGRTAMDYAIILEDEPVSQKIITYLNIIPDLLALERRTYRSFIQDSVRDTAFTDMLAYKIIHKSPDEAADFVKRWAEVWRDDHKTRIEGTKDQIKDIQHQIHSNAWNRIAAIQRGIQTSRKPETRSLTKN